MMEPTCSCGADFGFAFNHNNFSDAVLRIEIMTDPVDSATAIADCLCQGKRKRDEELFPSGTIVRVETLHISSTILADKSPFFFKLFWMKELNQTLKINASEEAAFMELLNFMYCNTLIVTAAPALLDVLVTADKFEVSSCMRYCTQLLLNFPMTPESALRYLELPDTVLMADAIQPLVDAAKQYVVGRYKNITKFQEEVMALPLSGIEAILASDDLQVPSEDAVYDFVLKWARKHYNKQTERRGVLSTRLVCLIRFPYMTCRKLREVLSCIDFRHKDVFELVREALIFKAEAPHGQWLLAAKEPVSLKHRFVQRAYKYHSVKVVKFELPQQRCVVYLDLKREECASLFPSGRLSSQAFHLGGQWYFLSAQCNLDQHDSFHCFELFVAMKRNGPGGFALVECEFAVRCKPTEEFVVSKKMAKKKFTGGDMFGRRNLFATPWTSFIADDSPFFINGVLHLKAELTIRH
ncbi:BTB/POZ domain-containing protein POB1-like [Lotus japonicus]|uniref:BTB/POZ domain-containing protein POB1-like n=1 Tax=Lotus japonicus TaxID=34305 RepID=UPI00258B183B|nr:BTB/POZ domain-containing protein POB1-like [Lotus japonicus]